LVEIKVEMGLERVLAEAEVVLGTRRLGKGKLHPPPVEETVELVLSLQSLGRRLCTDLAEVELDCAHLLLVLQLQGQADLVLAEVVL
jgi:hypothetical protein